MADQQLNIKLNVIDNASRAFTSVKNSIFNVRNALIGLGAGIAFKSLVDIGKQTNTVKIRLDELAKSGYGGSQAFDQLTKFAIQSKIPLLDVLQASNDLLSISKSPQELAKNSTDIAETNTRSDIWPWICALLLISNIGTLALLWCMRARSDSSTSHSRKSNTKENNVSVEGSWKEVRLACQSSSPKYMRSAILRWAPEYFNDPSILTLEQLALHYKAPKIKAALAELDAQLYSKQENSAFNGNALLSLLKKEDPSNKKKNTKEGLAPLYP